MRTLKLIPTALVLLLLLPTSPAAAGDGKVVVGSPHKMDLNLYYTYNESNMDRFKSAFTEASKRMFNATDGQLQFGTIRVSKNSSFENKADFWVLTGTGAANAGGFGILGNASGTHITIYQNTHSSTSGSALGQFGIVHELGHHAFDLRNEYHGGPPYTSSAYCISTSSSVACIMDGGTTVDPEHHRTEWCTNQADGLSTAHITSPESHQESHHGEACWETLASYCSSTYGAAMSEPATVDTSDPAGHVDPAWIIVGDDLRYVICLDKSYSMLGTKLLRAKLGADLFVDLGHEGSGEYLAVTSFSGGSGYDPAADVNMPLTEVVDDTVKDDARSIIGSIAVENMTAIGDGMRVSLDELQTMPEDDACVEAIVLLSDGEHNYGIENPDDVIPDLRDRGVRVFTIGLGSPPVLDEDMLQHIADETGGLYTHAATDEELSAIYTSYAAEIRGADVSSEDTGELSPEKYEYRESYVDQFTKEATFVLQWPTGGHALDLELERPDGVIIKPADAAGDPLIKYVQTPYYEFYRVTKPMRGTWKLWMFVRKATTRVPFTAQSLAEAPTVDFSVFVKRHKFKYPQVPVIQATLSAGPHVAGAKVEGVVVRPSPEQGVVDAVPMTLYDDGLQEHGDEMADDGIYSNRFLQFSRDGSYQLRFTAVNEDGHEAIPDEPTAEDWTPKPIPPFRRVAKNTVIIRGIPEVLPRPTVKEIDPAVGYQGRTMTVTVTGNNFVSNAVLSFSGVGIYVNSAVVETSSRIKANITIGAAAPLGERDVTVTNPGGYGSTAKGIFAVRPRPDCFPSGKGYERQHADWVLLGKPDCWCAPPDGSGYQCHGDVDGETSGIPFHYRCFTEDLRILVDNWRRSYKDPRFDPCADIDHKSSGPPFYYRVFTGDLRILITNWRKPNLPQDCPRPE